MTTGTVQLCITLLREEEKRLAKALHEYGVQVENVRSFELSQHIQPGFWGPRLALIRHLSHADAVSSAQLLQCAGVQTVNSIEAIRICGNKAFQALVFQRKGIPVPKSVVAFTLDGVREAGKQLGGAFVIKPVDGSWGRGIVRIVDDACFESWSAGRESCDAGQKSFPVVVQEYVDKGGEDYRIIIVENEPVVAFKRVSSDWKTNTHLGAKVVPSNITKEIRNLCAKVVSEIGPGFYGLDLMRDCRTGNMLVCEVNQNPEFAKSSDIHGVDIPRIVAAYVLRQLAMQRGAQEHHASFYREPAEIQHANI